MLSMRLSPPERKVLKVSRSLRALLKVPVSALNAILRSAESSTPNLKVRRRKTKDSSK